MTKGSILAAALAASLIAAGSASAAAKPAAQGGAPAPAATAKTEGPSGVAEIRALERGYAAAFRARDVNKIMSYYSRDGLFVFDVTPPRQHVGWEDYKKDWEGLFAVFTGVKDFNVTDLAVTVVGPVAYSHSIQPGEFITKGGPTVQIVVRVTDVYRKEAGRWRIVQEHVSVPVDIATGKADLLSKP